mgnify:FL=1|tara:strand:+ start:1 stop:861 length:861 start_codon:yes stop_codon:yes gene_type:complete
MPTPEFLLPDIDASKRKAVTTAFTNMAKAFGKEPWPYEKYKRDGLPNHAVIWGILRGSDLMFREAVAKQKTFYYVDHAYVDSGHDRLNKRNASVGKEAITWYRIIKNDHQIKHWGMPMPQIKSSDRLEKYFDIQLQNDKNDGDTILILPPTNAIKTFFKCHDWTDRIIEKYKNEKYVVREKPYNPPMQITNKGYMDKIDTPTDNSSGPIAEVMARTKKVVTYNSNSLVNAIIDGIDVEASNNSCWSIYDNDRVTWLKYLVHCQYNSHENNSGEWFDCCNSWQQTVQ